jgi:hypothetical protein
MNIHQLIAAINPDVFCEPLLRREVKRMLQDSFQRGDASAYLSAAAKARPVEANRIALDKLELENPFTMPAFKSPIQRHTLVYDSFDESLEALYFWMLDELATDGWTVSKLVDTFAAAPGSGLFSEMSRRETRAQQEATKLLREAHSLAQDILRTAVPYYQRAEEEGTSVSSHRSRADVERSLLQSKVVTLKLYSRWLGPYLKQIRQMGQHAKSSADLASLFNTAAMEIILIAERQYSIEEDVDTGKLPKFVLKAPRRTCNPVLIIELKIRAAPERSAGGAYGYRGRFELTLTSYALNPEELAVLRQELERDDLREVIGAVAGNAAGALSEIVEEIEGLVPEAAKEGQKPDDPNPFTALFDFKKSNPTRAPGSETISINASPRPIRSDSDIERVIRSQAILDARRRCLDFYTRCKQALKMVGV